MDVGNDPLIDPYRDFHLQFVEVNGKLVDEDVTLALKVST